MMLARVLVSAILLSGAVGAFAGPVEDVEQCVQIKDAKKRLACFDAAVPRLAEIRLQQAAEERRRLEVAAEAEKAAVETEKAKRQAAAHEVMDAFKKLRIRVRTGVTYREYPAILSDAKIAFERYVATPYAKNNVEIVKEIGAAMVDYEAANMVWQLKFAGARGVNRNLLRGESSYNYIMANYPKVSQYDRDGYLEIDYVMPVIWQYASAHLDEAEKVLSQSR